MNATITAFRTRTKPQALIEAPRPGTPLTRRIDVIQAQSERPLLKPVNAEPRDWKRWRKSYNRFLWHMREERLTSKHYR